VSGQDALDPLSNSNVVTRSSHGRVPTPETETGTYQNPPCWKLIEFPSGYAELCSTNTRSERELDPVNDIFEEFDLGSDEDVVPGHGHRLPAPDTGTYQNQPCWKSIKFPSGYGEPCSGDNEIPNTINFPDPNVERLEKLLGIQRPGEMTSYPERSINNSDYDYERSDPYEDWGQPEPPGYDAGSTEDDEAGEWRRMLLNNLPGSTDILGNPVDFRSAVPLRQRLDSRWRDDPQQALERRRRARGVLSNPAPQYDNNQYGNNQISLSRESAGAYVPPMPMPIFTPRVPTVVLPPSDAPHGGKDNACPPTAKACRAD
jgi:hypothetical protein